MEHVMNALVESIATQMWTLVREAEHRGMYRHNDWAWCIENMPRTAGYLRGKARAALNLGG